MHLVCLLHRIRNCNSACEQGENTQRMKSFGILLQKNHLATWVPALAGRLQVESTGEAHLGDVDKHRIFDPTLSSETDSPSPTPRDEATYSWPPALVWSAAALPKGMLVLGC